EVVVQVKGIGDRAGCVLPCKSPSRYRCGFGEQRGGKGGKQIVGYRRHHGQLDKSFDQAVKGREGERFINVPGNVRQLSDVLVRTLNRTRDEAQEVASKVEVVQGVEAGIFL